jgi:hypothetical protein
MEILQMMILTTIIDPQVIEAEALMTGNVEDITLEARVDLAMEETADDPADLVDPDGPEDLVDLVDLETITLEGITMDMEVPLAPLALLALLDRLDHLTMVMMIGNPLTRTIFLEDPMGHLMEDIIDQEDPFQALILIQQTTMVCQDIIIQLDGHFLTSIITLENYQEETTLGYGKDELSMLNRT